MRGACGSDCFDFVRMTVKIKLNATTVARTCENISVCGARTKGGFLMQTVLLYRTRGG